MHNLAVDDDLRMPLTILLATSRTGNKWRWLRPPRWGVRRDLCRPIGQL